MASSATRLRCFLAGLAAAVAASGTLGAAALAMTAAPVIPLARPAIEGNRAPYRMVFGADGGRLYVTESAEGAVAVLDPRARRVTARFSTGGRRPVGLALSPDGALLVVANSYSGSVCILDARTGARRALVPLPGMPWDIAVSPDGKRAFVTVSQMDEVAVLDLGAARVTARISVGRRPGALGLTPDGATLAVANGAAGSVSVVDALSLKEQARVRLKGVNVRGLDVTADGTEAYLTVMPAFNGRPTGDTAEIWHNLVQAVSLAGAGSAVGEDQWMDFARIKGTSDVVGTPDQHDIVLDRTAMRAWMAVSGRDVVTRITIHDRKRDAIWPISQVETQVGANPRGLALSPDGREVWVANHLGNSLSVIDADSAALLATVPLGEPGRRDPTILGQYLFHSAGLTRGHRFTCGSCHPDGGSDGLTWSFVHVKDGFVRRNSRDLRTGLEGTAPFRWSGLEAHLTEFLEDEVTGLLQGPRPTPEQTRALADAIGAFRLPDNPYRGPGGALTAKALAGRSLFEGRAGCAGCHAGPRRGGSGIRAWIGTTPPGTMVDVPHLEGVYDSRPYLHDGRAATLEQLFENHDPGRRHGAAHLLSPDDRAALLRFLREL